MQVLVVGLGSMGRRRIRLLKEILHHEVIGVDTSEERRIQCEAELHIKTYSTIMIAFQKCKIDAAVVSTSPLTHFSIIKELLMYNVNVFTEINLVSDGYDELIELAEKKNKILFLSSTMLYRYEVQRIEKIIKNEKNLVYTYHIGQYLPDWHPWENYKDFFVSNKRTNACREIFAIELPWLISLFGNVTNYQVIKKKNTSLDIEYPDTYLVLLQHENQVMGSLTVDVVSRTAIRDFKLYNENIFIDWNGTPDGYREFNKLTNKMKKYNFEQEIIKDNNYADNIIENDYLEELSAFFDKIKNPEHQYYDFKADLQTLNLITTLEN